MPALLLTLGLVLLAAGGEVLVRGATRLARACGVSPLVIGLTVVGYGTSAPELAVDVKAALAGRSGLVIGDIVGSCIFNILFILGLCALFRPITVATRVVRIDVPIMTGAALAVYFLSLSGVIGRWDGVLLVSGVAAYTIFTVRQSRSESSATQTEFKAEYAAPGRGARSPLRFWIAQLALVVAGITMLVLGARWAMTAAVAIARAFGVSDLVIGLAVIAPGTGLPELATAIAATARRESDIATGNLVGSNIFNLTWVLGAAAIVAPNGLQLPPAALRFDLPVLIAVSVACLPIFFRKHLISRWEGALFLAYYLAYTGYLVLDARNHDALGMFSAVMCWFVMPLTGVTLVLLAARELPFFAKS